MAEPTDKPEQAPLVKEDPKKKKDPSPAVGFFQLFRYADLFDVMLMLVGTVASAGLGGAMPLFSIIFGNVLNDLALSPPDKVVDLVSKSAIYFLIIGGGSGLLSWFGLGFWMWVSERITRRVRVNYFKALLRQDVAWYDSHKPGALSATLASDTLDFANGTGEKVSTFLQNLFTFLAGIIIGFVKGWQLTLVVLSVGPLLGVVGAVTSTLMVRLSGENQEAYGLAGSVAEESFQNIKTVAAFHREKAQSDRYDRHLQDVVSSGVRKSSLAGSTMGLFNFFMFGAYGLCMWFGIWLIRRRIVNPATGEVYSGGAVMTVFFSVLIGASALGRCAPAMESFATARAAAYRLYSIIDRKPPIDVYSTEGQKLNKIEEINFQDVEFEYPSRPGVKVYERFNLRIAAGQRIALVGGTGSGKSTVIGLLERFYDPTGGKVLINNVPLTDLNLGWWRQQVGIVSQEPLLFDGSVLDNIRYGKPDATDEDVIAAAKAANAHTFIVDLKDGYNTRVGEGGSMLSGGQKQRVAIARTLLLAPSVLLLDEATSALDNESERIVQDALDKVMQGRTTIVVAHRLSTIINSDLIYVLQAGKIVEQGKHDELLAQGGVYAHLIAAQQQASEPVKQVKADGDSNHPGDEVPVDGPKASEDHLPVAVRVSISERHDETKIDAPKEAAAVEEKYPTVPIGRVWKMGAPDWPYTVMGMIGAIVGGCAMPLFALIFGEMSAVFYEFDPIAQDLGARKWALAFLGLGFGVMVAAVAQELGFAVMGQRLTLKIRKMLFQSMLRNEVSWFDEASHNSRILGNILAAEASLIEGGTAKVAGMTLQMITTLAVGLFVSLYYSWQIGLVVLACGPVLVGTSAMQMKLFTGFNVEGQKAFEAAGKLSGEAIGNIKTVSAFNAQHRVVKQFDLLLKGPMKIGTKKAHISGLSLGLSQLAVFAVHALTWWFAATRVSKGQLTFGDMMKAVFAIFMAAMGVGFITSMMPDVQKASAAKDKVFALLDRKSRADPLDEGGSKASLAAGSIDFEDVHFAYPGAPQRPILRGVSFRVAPGETVALVGTSGSGKSTIVSLLLRFYELVSNPACARERAPDNPLLKGTIRLDGNDISEMNLEALRSQLGLVSQEPSLFDMTIEENICVGKPGASFEEVVAAARAANVHDFIDSLPNKYKTEVGVRGTQLSGGQKQRIAIARALIRNPKVLLLDEATSALDAESERVVQEALDRLMATKERTIVVIAHRLSTVRHADKIIVLTKGKVREVGNHDQLMERNGIYANLVHMAH